MKPRTTNLKERLRATASSLPLDAKRKPTRRQGIESWYPYYAGFTEEFASGVIGELACDPSVCVMDPWNGSGTTTRVAHALGHRALGFDLNPVASLVASAKIAHASDAQHVVGLAKRISKVAPVDVDDADPLRTWLAPSVVGQYRAIERTLLAEMATTASGESASALAGDFPPLVSFLLLALVRTAREFATVSQGTNPTWIRPGDQRKRAIRTLGARWTSQVAAMADELHEAQAAESAKPWSGSIAVADSRNLPVDDDSVDLILTSPPYCTRIDYIVSTSFELAALGLAEGSKEYQDLRRASMGTPLARKGAPPDVPSGWPQSVAKLLSAIREHPSKASRSYYYKTFWQYFHDALGSLQEFDRVMHRGGAALLVVQTSHYKDLFVDLPGLYIDMAHSVGLRGSVIGEAPVRRAIAQIHPHAARHRASADYREAVIALEKAA